eukprot:13092462-Alexandrium_andersonii.AAC.1
MASGPRVWYPGEAVVHPTAADNHPCHLFSQSHILSDVCRPAMQQLSCRLCTPRPTTHRWVNSENSLQFAMLSDAADE